MLKKVILILVLLFPLTLFAQTDFRAIGQPEKLAGGDGNYFMQPVWSPDGFKIAFTSSNYKGLWVIRTDEKELVKLSEDAGIGLGFQWSPDSKAIVGRTTKYIRGRNQFAIKLFNVETNEENYLVDYSTAKLGSPKWTDDQQVVYYTRNQKLEIVENIYNQKKTDRLSETRYFIKDNQLFKENSPVDLQIDIPKKGEEVLINVRLSPDRRKISYEVLGGNLFVVDIDGLNRIDIGKGYRASWSPDSKSLVYMVTEDDGYTYQVSDLYIFDVIERKKIQLTDTRDQIEMDPCWSPDGKRIVYNEYKKGAIYLLNIVR